MQKLFISGFFIATLFVGGCSTMDDMGNAMPNVLTEIPLVYKPEVQQGNVVTQEMVDKLQPGMNRRQVTYILGTPLLVDAFHQDRWDYIYTRETGGGTDNKEQISLFFEDDTLIKVEGDFRPKPKKDPLSDGEETVFSVPDYGKKEKGFFTRTLESMGIDTDEVESTPSAAGMGEDDKLPEMNNSGEDELPQTAEEAQAGSTQIQEQETQVDNTQKPEEEKGFFSRTLEAIGF
ncbi:MAG: outer membrane protein assembly factor BamE [Gammaproteobacteria bacterium]|nr:outer membrane protein assembly factor BamE [Gammaproteobacteria bacterium]